MKRFTDGVGELVMVVGAQKAAAISWLFHALFEEFDDSTFLQCELECSLLMENYVFLSHWVTSLVAMVLRHFSLCFLTIFCWALGWQSELIVMGWLRHIAWSYNVTLQATFMSMWFVSMKFINDEHRIVSWRQGSLLQLFELTSEILDDQMPCCLDHRMEWFLKRNSIEYHTNMFRQKMDRELEACRSTKEALLKENIFSESTVNLVMEYTFYDPIRDLVRQEDMLDALYSVCPELKGELAVVQLIVHFVEELYRDTFVIWHDSHEALLPDIGEDDEWSEDGIVENDHFKFLDWYGPGHEVAVEMYMCCATSLASLQLEGLGQVYLFCVDCDVLHHVDDGCDCEWEEEEDDSHSVSLSNECAEYAASEPCDHLEYETESESNSQSSCGSDARTGSSRESDWESLSGIEDDSDSACLSDSSTDSYIVKTLGVFEHR